MKKIRREFLDNTGYVCKARYRQLQERFGWKEIIWSLSKRILIFFFFSWYKNTYTKFFLIYSKLISKQTITKKAMLFRNITTTMYLHFNQHEYEVFLQTAEKEPETHAFNPLSTEANTRLNITYLSGGLASSCQPFYWLSSDLLCFFACWD